MKNNKIICRAGEPIEAIYFVVHGVVNISINTDGKEVIIDSITQGASIGCSGILNKCNHNFTVRAGSKVTIYLITRDNLIACMNTCDDLDKGVTDAQKYYETRDLPWIDFRISRLQEKPVPNKHILKLAIVRLLRIKRSFSRRISADEILETLKDMQVKYNKSYYGSATNGDGGSVAVDMIGRLMKKIDLMQAKLDEQDRRLAAKEAKSLDHYASKFGAGKRRGKTADNNTKDEDTKSSNQKSEKSLDGMLDYFELPKLDDKDDSTNSLEET